MGRISRERRARLEPIRELPEELQVEIVAALGCVFNEPDGPTYWRHVWDYLIAHHRDMLLNPCVDYPVEGRDMKILEAMWVWQDKHWKGNRS